MVTFTIGFTRRKVDEILQKNSYLGLLNILLKLLFWLLQLQK
ncbi:hypothetical protein HMPREF0653_01751 [Prevotella disiens JCM 6334 = ATCC 29426]|uniref:Uncharacterized protein n=1 Tax=Prevotella disiens JCM 6334 = ATCC 29426 TaxID=1235811 RepID=A0ABN0NR48_9BACT|nr:hypothetical protein HMPREF0653_01751 [Prevotella disiens JCM 6334 = ATCC 29426]